MNYFENDLKSLHEGLVNKDFSAEELAKETFETIRETCLTEFLSGSKTTS